MKGNSGFMYRNSPSGSSKNPFLGQKVLGLNTYSAMNKYSAAFFDKNPFVLCLVDVMGQIYAEGAKRLCTM
jgi:hypothetical protein